MSFEDKLLVENVKGQLSRLVQQMKDLDECKNDMTTEEYEELREDTKDQLREFETSLEKMSCGDLSLIDSLGAVRLAVRAAISEAFRTPDVIKMFAEKQTGGLRQKLVELDRDVKIGALPRDAFVQQKLEVLAALKRLDDQLSPDETNFFSEHSTQSMRQFTEVSAGSSLQDTASIISLAKRE